MSEVLRQSYPGRVLAHLLFGLVVVHLASSQKQSIVRGLAGRGRPEVLLILLQVRRTISGNRMMESIGIPKARCEDQG